MMKLLLKCTVILLTGLSLITPLNPVSIHAAVSQQQIIVGNITGKAGETVEVPITMKSDGHIAAIQLRLAYDRDTLELMEVAKGSDLAAAFSILSNLENGKLVIGSLGSVIGMGTQEVAIAVFKIKASAVTGTIKVELSEASFTDSEANNLSNQFDVVHGLVTIDNAGVIPVTGIILDSNTLQLTAGGTIGSITAMVAPANATNKTVIWSSSNKNVATVADGVVTPMAAGTATITAATEDGSFTAESVVTVKAESDGGGGGNNSTPIQPNTPTLPEASTTEAVIFVNGKAESVGTATTTTVDDQQVTTVKVDSQVLENLLAEEADGILITISVNTQSDVVISEFNGQIIKSMEQKHAIVEIRTDHATYTLPAEQINISALSEQTGRDVELQDIHVRIAIAAPTEDMLRIVESSALKEEFTLVAPPISFTVTCTLGDTTEDVSRFNAYVERTIAIPDGVSPDKITTGVVVDSDGIARHVPTRIIPIDGKYYATVNSLTNSTYTIIYHPIAFKDVANHWAKEAVNDMGSRMVVSGIGNDMFKPNQEITRAEFAAIVVRGLGLKRESGDASFPDVSKEAWYDEVIQTAYDYRLINGFEDGSFKPNDRITREQAMTIIASAMQITNLTSKLSVQTTDEILHHFQDTAEASSWAKKGIAAAVQAGIVSGRSEDQLAPRAFITRAEVAKMIQTLLQKSELI